MLLLFYIVHTVDINLFTMCILVIIGATLVMIDCIGCHVCSKTDSIFSDREALLSLFCTPVHV